MDLKQATDDFLMYLQVEKNYSKNTLNLKHNFMLGVQAPKSDKKLPVYMTLQELQKLFAYLENSTDRFASRNHVMFKLLATTGMRRQELVDLTWEQIDMV